MNLYKLLWEIGGKVCSYLATIITSLETIISNQGGGETQLSVTNESNTVFEQFEASLANGAEIDSGFIDFENWSKYDINFKSDVVGLTLVQESRDDVSQTILSNSIDFTASSLFLASFPTRQRFIRFRLQNNTGSPVTNVSMVVSGKTTGDDVSVFPLDISPQNFSSAALTQSVLIGEDPLGNFRNTTVNESGALLTSDFGTEVARGLYSNYTINTKFGRNASIDTTSAPEDVWNGGSDYTGFNCTQAETLSVVSSSANDSGSLVSSGTATGGNGTTLIDTVATFVTDGVSVGDIILNDTQVIHGIVSEVTSETVLTVRFFKDSVGSNEYVTNVGDSYRVATSSSTGAAVIKLNAALDGNYNPISEYVILNGTTPVVTTKQYIRQARATVEIAGSTGNNEGEITANQSITTANVTMVMPADSGQTAICCSTVPAGKRWVTKHLQAGMVRLNGSAGSAQVQFQVRERGGAWQTKRFEGISDSLLYDEMLVGGIVIEEQSDVRWRVQSVSDNNTQVTALFEYFEIVK